MLKEIDQKQLKLVTELLQTYLLYATIALIVILAVTALLIKLKAPDKLKAFSKVTLGIIIGYSVAVILGIGSLIISRMYLKDEINYVFWMTAGLILLMIALITAGAIIKLVKPSAFKIFAIAECVFANVCNITWNFYSCKCLTTTKCTCANSCYTAWNCYIFQRYATTKCTCANSCYTAWNC